MKRYAIAFAPDAQEQAAKIRAWWLEHRPGARALFDEELVAAAARIAVAPETGPRYVRRGTSRELRRVLLPKTRYHLYYSVDDLHETITILAMWHATRGRGPLL